MFGIWVTLLAGMTSESTDLALDIEKCQFSGSEKLPTCETAVMERPVGLRYIL